LARLLGDLLREVIADQQRREVGDAIAYGREISNNVPTQPGPNGLDS
jgi:hypothetical protein